MGLQVSILPDSPKTLAKPDTATNSGALWSALAMLYNINWDANRWIHLVLRPWQWISSNCNHVTIQSWLMNEIYHIPSWNAASAFTCLSFWLHLEIVCRAIAACASFSPIFVSQHVICFLSGSCRCMENVMPVLKRSLCRHIILHGQSSCLLSAFPFNCGVLGRTSNLMFVAELWPRS